MNRTTEMGRSLAIIVPQKMNHDEKGSFLEQLAAQILRRQSYEITTRVRFTGMEIDLLCIHKPSNEKLYVECKFHINNLSANVIDQCVGQALRRKIQNVALFSAGPLGKDAKGAVVELRDNPEIRFSYYGTEEILEALTDSGVSVRIPDQNKLPSSITHATLLVHPEMPYIWLLQEQRDARPYRLIPYTDIPVRHRPTLKILRDVLDLAQMLEGLEVAQYLEIGAHTPIPPDISAVPPTEHVSLIATADSLVDYRPCRPADFVGRTTFQKELWDFFEGVRNDRSATRLVAITGASGFGKSSLVAKLANRFTNRKWRNRLFMYPVDVRSARGTMFVSEALLQSIRAAQHAGFINSNIHPQITDADNILSGDSITSVIDELRKNSRLLILFFDQFEEIFTKEELLPLFRVFKRFALDINALQSNLIVGFSWRTGISFSDDNPAYQLWHELSDHRLTKIISSFDPGESSRMISQFEHVLRQKFVPPLRRRLVEQSQGMPWLLKKLCIHVYRQIQNGNSQIELLSSRLNVKNLFDEDLNPLTEAQSACLRYIAFNSPADSSEVHNLFPDDVVASLTNLRIIIRTGQRLTVYWDIFRDYITEGAVPTIPWTYIPNSQPSMSIRALRVIEQHQGISVAALSKELQYTEKTTFNIVTDLLSMMVCEKSITGGYVPAEGVSLSTVAERIRSQFSDHIVYQILIKDASEPRLQSREAGVEIVREIYSTGNVKPKTRDNYFNKLIQWLKYAGLIETIGSEVRVYPPSQKSLSYGQVSLSTPSHRAALFLGSAPPESSIALFGKTLSEYFVQREFILSNGYRNAAQDLVALGLCKWLGPTLIPTKPKGVDAVGELRCAVAQSSVIVFIDSLFRSGKVKSRKELGNTIGTQIGKCWKETSAVRYANGLCRYWKFIQDR